MANETIPPKNINFSLCFFLVEVQLPNYVPDDEHRRLINDVQALQEFTQGIDNQKLRNILTTSDKIESLSKSNEKVNKLESDLALFSGHVQDLQRAFNQFHVQEDLVKVDHAKLNFTSVKENIAISDLANLSNIVFSLATELQNLKQNQPHYIEVNNTLNTLSKQFESIRQEVQNLKSTSDMFHADHSKLKDTSVQGTEAIKDLASLTTIVLKLSSDLKTVNNTLFQDGINKDLMNEFVSMKMDVKKIIYIYFV